MSTALIATFFYVAYSAALGVMAGLSYRYARGLGRYLPMLSALSYYALSWLYPHHILREAKSGAPATGDDWRFVASSLTVTLSLYFLMPVLTRRANETEL